MIDGAIVWEQIGDGAPALIQPPYGSLPEQTPEALVVALTRDRERECNFIHWAGYVENDILPREGVVVPAWALSLIRGLSVGPEKSIRQDVPLDIAVIRKPLSWLAYEPPLHTQQCPVLILPHDCSFVMACPIYHNSMYIGCTRELGGSLLVADLDSYPISLDGVIRGTID